MINETKKTEFYKTYVKNSWPYGIDIHTMFVILKLYLFVCVCDQRVCLFVDENVQFKG